MQIGPEKESTSAFTVFLQDCTRSLAISGLLTVHKTFHFAMNSQRLAYTAMHKMASQFP